MKCFDILTGDERFKIQVKIFPTLEEMRTFMVDKFDHPEETVGEVEACTIYVVKEDQHNNEIQGVEGDIYCFFSEECLEISQIAHECARIAFGCARKLNYSNPLESLEDEDNITYMLSGVMNCMITEIKKLGINIQGFYYGV